MSARRATTAQTPAPVRPLGAWAVVNDEGHIFRDTVSRTRGEAIDAYLADGSETSWRWHRENHGVRVERVTIAAAESDG